MSFEGKVRTVQWTLFLAFVFVLASLAQLNQKVAAHYRLYEFLGIVMACMITVFGLWRMKVSTE